MKVTARIGELKDHMELLAILKQAIRDREFSLIVIFPTLSLLHAVQDELLDQPEIRSVGGFRFLLFEGFIGELREQFGLNSNTPSPLERDLILQSVLLRLDSEGNLNFLNKIPYTFNYRQAILDGMAEWKRSGLTPELFAEWSVDKGAKEQELALVYQLYQTEIIGLGLTDDDLTLEELQMLRMTDSGSESSFPTPSRIILYGFTDLTPLQTDYIKALEVWFEFSAIVDPTAVPEFQQLTQGYFPYRQTTVPVQTLSGNALHSLQSVFWVDTPHELSLDPEDISIQLIQAAGNRQAVGIARAISGIIRTREGYGPDDFLILAQDSQGFTQMARPVFKEYQLEISQITVPLRETAVVNQFLKVLGVVANDWQWPDMVILLHHIYRGTEVSAGDRLLLFMAEQYGAFSGRERWVKMIQDNEFLKKLTERSINFEPLQYAVQQLQQLTNSNNYRSFLEYARQWLITESDVILNSSNVNIPLMEEIRNYQAAQELIGTITTLLEAEIGRPLMEQPVSPEEFRQFFEEQLAVTDLKLHQGLSEGIRVISPREVRGLTSKVVFITGLEEGNFPRFYINDWKLDASDRFDLKTLGVEMENGENYQFQEKLSFYWGLQAATEQVYFVYRDQDADGQLTNISPFLSEILAWYPALRRRTQVYHLEPKVCNKFEDCFSYFEERQLWVTYSLSPTESLNDTERQIYQHLLSQAKYRSLGANVKYWGGYHHLDRYQPFGVTPLIQKLLNENYGEEACIGITAIEDYLSCPYRFFLKNLLKIKPIAEASLLPEALDLGNLYHQVFAQFGNSYRDQALIREKLPEYRDYLNTLVSETIDQWKKDAANDLIQVMLSAQTADIERTIERWILAEIEWSELTASRFHPYITEFAFGRLPGTNRQQGNSPCFEVDDDQIKIRLSGRIDRIDRDETGNFIIYDYKLSQGPTTADLKSLKKIQLPAYLLVVESLLKGDAVGAAYLGLRDPSRSRGGIWHKGKLRIDWRSNGQFNDDEWEAWLEEIRLKLIDTVRNIRAGSFRLTEENCLAYCEYSNCCRRREREVEMVGTYSK